MRRWSLQEETVEVWVGYVLRGGAFVSAALLALGSALEFTRAATPFSVVSGFPHSIRAVAAGVLAGDPLSFISLGVLALIATPWVCVAISLALFLRLRDRIYSSICFLLLVLLTLGLFVEGR
jgi:uncharacterized membrane protein